MYVGQTEKNLHAIFETGRKNTPCIIFFDEFEKVYEKKEWQEAILTFLDGAFGKQDKLYLFTINSITSVSEFFKNRPSRVRYLINFDNMEEEAIREYCNENLNDKTKILEVISFSSECWEFNFDMLQALVREMNLFNESVAQATKVLNVKSFLSKDSYDYNGEASFDKELPVKLNIRISNDPRVIFNNGHVYAYITSEDVSEEDEAAMNPYIKAFGLYMNDDNNQIAGHISLSESDLSGFSSSEKKYIFEKTQGSLVLRISITCKKKTRTYDYLV
jgi:hypothetical protein